MILRPICSRVPAELWLMIWKTVDMPDRVHISQVCRAWRAMALSDAFLWQHIELYCDNHSAACSCARCRFGGRHGTLRDNSRLVSIVLERSRSLPLILRITDGGPDTDVAFWSQDAACSFASVIRPHLGRLVAIDAKLKAGKLLCWLLYELRTLPALVALSHSRSTPIQRHKCSMMVFEHPVAMPMLRTLALTHGVVNWSEDPWPSYPTVTTLRFAVEFVYDLFEILIACPNVSVLEAYMRGFRPFAGVVEALRSIPCVRVFDIAAPFADRIRSIFACPARREYHLEYTGPCTSGALQVLLDLEAPTRLSCTLDGTDDRVALTLRLSAPGGEMRSLKAKYAARCLDGVWSKINHASLLHFEVDVRLWPATAKNMPQLPALETLCVLVDGGTEQLALPRGYAQLLPALKEVTLRGQTRRSAMLSKLTMDDIVASLGGAVTYTFERIVFADAHEEDTRARS